MEHSLEPRRPKGRRRAVLVTLLAAAVAVAALVTLRTGGRPAVAVEPAMPGFGPRTPVAVTASEPRRGLAAIVVELVQGERRETLLERRYTPLPPWSFWGAAERDATLDLEVGGETVEWLRDGEATLVVSAEPAGTWLRRPAPTVVETTLPVRLHPPAVTLVSRQNYADQGGSGVVVYRVGEAAAESAVTAGAWRFPGHPLPGGGPGERFALFAVPYDLDDPDAVLLEVADELGNRASTRFLDLLRPHPYATGTIELDDRFIERVVPEIVERTPDFEARATPLDTYLAINGELRRRQDRELVELAAASRPELLWRRPFLPMRNAQVMSPFAARRTYYYGGRPVDEQFHLGFDLASVRRAPIEAANDGVVALAEYFGIYGNAVVIDHGYGLMSLYGHLSAIGVSPGERVERGQVIGASGETGLAGGDHLHFAILLGGLPVNPVEWWDPAWVRDRVAAKLGGAFELGGG